MPNQEEISDQAHGARDGHETGDPIEIGPKLPAQLALQGVEQDPRVDREQRYAEERRLTAEPEELRPEGERRQVEQHADGGERREQEPETRRRVRAAVRLGCRTGKEPRDALRDLEPGA